MSALLTLGKKRNSAHPSEQLFSKGIWKKNIGNYPIFRENDIRLLPVWNWKLFKFYAYKLEGNIRSEFLLQLLVLRLYIIVRIKFFVLAVLKILSI